MKLAILSAIVGAAAAFAPSSSRCPSLTSSSSSLQAEKKEKVPCFGATPLGGEPVFIGENYWDKITQDWGTADTGTFVQAAELKHGRSAMLATVGFAFHKLGLTLNNISPHEYLSESQGVKFADLAAMTPLEALYNVPFEGLVQIFCFIAAVELYEIAYSSGAFQLQSGGLTGDLGFNPLKIKITDRRRLVELQNGRAAMFAIMAWIAHDAVEGSVPLSLPWP